MYWSHLPPEIRTQILHALVADKSCKLASASAVSREWQGVIELHTFAYIRLSPTRITALNSMTRRNRDFVRYIWFCIELERYDCSKCDTRRLNAIETSYGDNEPILESFLPLFSALGTWEPSEGLTLDISLYSTSDREHAFRFLTFLPDAPGQSQHEAEHILPAQSDALIDKHRWVASAAGPLIPPERSLERIFANVWLHPRDEDDCWQQTPEVPAVTRLVMRLQTHRGWQPYTVMRMLSRLTRPREFHYEPWRHGYLEMQEFLDEDFFHLLAATEGLNRVTIFENFNQQYPLYWFEDTGLTRAPNVTLGQQLAGVNLGAEALSASFIVDAEDFFSVPPPTTWSNLTYLALTSQLLSPKTCPLKMNHLLQAAASTAYHMPKLKTMEIWNGLSGLAALFKYEFMPGYLRRSVITWRATWHLPLHAQIIEDWEAVRHSDGIDVVYEMIKPEEITSHADAVVSLKLSEMVIRPVSLQQIKIEQGFIQSL